MKDNRIYDKMEQDEFGKLISDKLDDHRMPVDKECWSVIEKKVNSKPTKKIWFYIGSAAAIVGVLLFVLNPFRDLSNNQPDKTVADKPIEISQAKDSITKSLPAKNQVITSVYPKRLISTQDEALVKMTNDSDSNIIFVDSIKDYIENEFIVLVPENKESEQKKEKTSDVHADSVKDISIDKLRDQLLAENLVVLQKPGTNRSWTLGLAVNAGQGISNMNTGNDYAMDLENGGGTSSGDPNYLEDNLARKDWEVDYKLPISVGFLVKKNFGNTFSLESGLVYTYLSSTLKKEVSSSAGSMLQKGSLQLHYLGIPLNAVVNVWSDQNWKIYLSGGTMFEKGVRSNEKIRTYKNDIKVGEDTESKSWIHGSQWSINGSLGASYKLTRSWEIYFEPRVSYYFDNKQPASMRTEKPTMFNFNAGVKFNLK